MAATAITALAVSTCACKSISQYWYGYQICGYLTSTVVCLAAFNSAGAFSLCDIINRVAENTASENELQLFQHGLEDNP